MKKRSGRKSLRDTLIENAKAQEFYKTMFSGISDVMRGSNLQVIKIPDAPKPRQKSAEPRTDLLEKDIQKQILMLLRKHPRVQWVARFNSGTFMDGDRYITSNSQRGMSDILGMLKGGRLFAIECKSRTGRIQPHQQEFLDLINAGGGVAFVARSVDDVLNNMYFDKVI
jgi:hypothetical protein